MQTKKIDAEYTAAGQIAPRDVEVVHAMGFRSILCLRPDDETGPDGQPEEGQPLFEEIAAAARLAGLEAAHLPVAGSGSGSGPTEADAARFREVMERLPKPVLAYCRAGGRARRLREMTA